ncbi:DUF4190 domain-containing protein [Micromonospora sp. HM5-17]|nr:DUF4190 domain-containing protein [Micromonospora sp. HM5-17]
MAGQPYGAAPGYPKQNNTLGLIALIVGIAAIPLGICCTWVSFLPGIAAIVLGLLGRSKAKQGEASNGGQALAGVICGAIGILIGVIWIVLVVALDVGSYMLTP